MTTPAKLSTALESKSLTLICVGVLSLAFALGGGQGALGDSLTQIMALLLIGLLLYRQPDIRQWPAASGLALLPVIAIAIYLLPWPEVFSQAGEMRRQIAQSQYSIIGDGMQTGALIPLSGERAIFWLLPGIAVFWAALQSTLRQKTLFAGVVLLWVFIGVLIGLAQKADGPESILYFFSNTNRGISVGLFANANHYAIAMAASLPLVWATFAYCFNQALRQKVNPLWYISLSAIAILFIVGFMLSGSRAGLALGMLGCFLMLPAVISADQREGAKHWMFAVMAIGLLLSVQIGLYFILLNFEDNPLLDGRWQLNAYTAAAAAAFAPVGSGPGSFWFVFPQFGGLFTGPYIANHAHNDYLELWLEMRWLALAAGLPLLAAYLWQGLRIWVRGKSWKPNELLLARAAWVGLLLLMIHSFVDYPLRTSAISSMAGLFAALLYLPASARATE